MSIYWPFLVAALALVGSQGTQGQDRLNSLPKVTVAGCVSQAQRTGSLADDTSTRTPVTPNTSGIEANSAEPVNSYILLNATPINGRSAEGGPEAPTTYSLQGHESELATHRGHRIEVVGHLLPSQPAAARAEKPATTNQRIAVQSVKMLANRCPAAASPTRGGKG
jgi:hypothetical protein